MEIRSALLLAIVFLTVFAVFFLVAPIPQDLTYHKFADSRVIWGIPNALNILSNIPFVLIGIWGIAITLRHGLGAFYLPYIVFFVGVSLTGFGSSYYHYDPSNDRLFWDRLFLTIAFAGLFASVISELISRKASIFLLFPLLTVGMGSVFHWDWSETHADGDLRLYAIFQFLPIILIPLMLFLYELPAKYLRYIIGLIIFYLISKILELLDYEIFSVLQVISGHTLKHLVAAGGICFVLRMLSVRAGDHKRTPL